MEFVDTKHTSNLSTLNIFGSNLVPACHIVEILYVFNPFTESILNVEFFLAPLIHQIGHRINGGSP